MAAQGWGREGGREGWQTIFFPLIFHGVCKQVLPHAALGGKAFHSANPSPFLLHSAKLPLAPWLPSHRLVWLGKDLLRPLSPIVHRSTGLFQLEKTSSFPPCRAKGRWKQLPELRGKLLTTNQTNPGEAEQHSAGSSGLVPC